MTPNEYLVALVAAGIPESLPVLKIDREASSLLGVSERTARRYRCGYAAVPGPVVVALTTLAHYRTTSEDQ